MKVIGINGSPKESGSTTMVGLNHAMSEIQKLGIEAEVIELSQYDIKGCDACDDCKKTGYCSINDKFSSELYDKLADEDVKGIIFASPVYFGGITSQLKALLDRCVVFRRKGFMWENRIAGVLTIGGSRNGGQELAAMNLVASAMIHGMIVVPDASPTSHFGGLLHARHEGGVTEDKLGLDTAINLGKKVGEVVKKLHS